jgi:hypothetical protein
MTFAIKKQIIAIIFSSLPIVAHASENPTPDYVIASMDSYVQARELSKCVSFHGFMLDHIDAKKNPILTITYRFTGDFYAKKLLDSYAKAGAPVDHVGDEASAKIQYYRSFFDKYFVKAGMLPESVVKSSIEGCKNLI